MRLSSPAFANGEPIPKKYTEDGNNLSPPLRWNDVPEAARELALIVDDPDAPRADPWVHWVAYKIPAELRELPEGLARLAALERPPLRQGFNSFQHDNVGYRGPAPPKGHGPHHYHFRLYALREPLNLAPEVSKAALLKAIEGRVLAHAELIGTYERR